MTDTTVDVLLNGQIKLKQPKYGYRVSIDPFVLADIIELKPAQRVLDVGCGVGLVSLLIKHKEPTSYVSAIDIDGSMCEMCRQNAILNNKEINVICDDISRYLFGVNAFDLVVTNPPYYSKNNHRVSSHRECTHFETISLESWIVSSLKPLKNGGIFAIIHTASRINEIMRVLDNRVGGLRIFPVFTKNGISAKRVVIVGKKGSRSETQIMPSIAAGNERLYCTE